MYKNSSISKISFCFFSLNFILWIFQSLFSDGMETNQIILITFYQVLKSPLHSSYNLIFFGNRKPIFNDYFKPKIQSGVPCQSCLCAIFPKPWGRGFILTLRQLDTPYPLKLSNNLSRKRRTPPLSTVMYLIFWKSLKICF